MDAKGKVFLKKKTPKKLYLLGFAGIFPNLGLITGTILVFQGFKRRNNKLKLLGLAGILFTPLFWYVFSHSDLHKRQTIELTNYRLNEVVKDLEFYNIKNGQYPDSLAQLKKQNNFFADEELFNEGFTFKKIKPARFYFKRLDNDYVLKSFGPDLILNIKDDIYPEFKR